MRWIIKMKKQKKPHWPDYEVIDLDKLAGTKVVTFGTTLFQRKDGQALRIVFPCGQTFTWCPQE